MVLTTFLPVINTLVDTSNYHLIMTVQMLVMDLTVMI